MEPDDIGRIRQYSRQYAFTVRSTDTGPDDRITPHAFTSLIQEAASADAEALGFGAGALDPQGICWILLRTSLRFYDRPKWREKVVIDTWTNGFDRLLALREFHAAGEDGRMFARATTSWILADTRTRRPRKFEAEPDSLMARPTLSALGFPSPKIREEGHSFPEGPAIIKFAGYSEIDRNRHVNNTRYIAWCLDALAETIPAGWRTAGFDINYVSEVTMGESVGIYCAASSDTDAPDGLPGSSYLISGRHRSDGRTSFTARFTMEKA